MNFLELMLCTALIGILSVCSVFGYQSLMTRTRLHSDTQIIFTALNQARAQGGSVACVQEQCILYIKEKEKIFKLSGLNQVETRLFPGHAQGFFVFTPEGLSAFHNGTIEVSVPDHPDLTRSIVVSQGGRIRSA